MKITRRQLHQIIVEFAVRLDRHKRENRSDSVKLYSYVREEDLESILKWGLLGTRGIIQRPELTNSLFPDKRGKAEWISSYDEGDITLQGPSVFFQYVPQEFIFEIDDNHLMKRGKYICIEIDWSGFKRDNPHAYIFGLEMVPYRDEEYSDRRDEIEYEMSDDEVGEMSEKSYHDVWRNYVPGYFAGGVPHGIVMSDFGGVPPEYLEVKK